MKRHRSPIRPNKRAILFGAVGATILVANLETRGLARSIEASIYPPARASAITFDHSAHDASSCTTCHAGIARSARANDSHAPGMATCAECHGQRKEDAPKPHMGACSACHQGYKTSMEKQPETQEQWRAITPAPMIIRGPEANLKFPHSKHNGAPCSTCHAPDTSGVMGMPSMASCQTCHNDTIAAAKCSTCHTHELSAPKTSRTDTKPSSRPRLEPSNHEINWLARHGAIAKSNPTECATCHQETQCLDCHQDKSGQLLSQHPPNYVILHRVAAKGAEQNCTDCHRNETTCVDCHTRARASTRPDGLPPSGLSFHPPGWVDSASASNHGVMARRNINDCASCHSQQDCVSCHQGINPHPDSFALDCERMLAANPRPCLECHTSTAGLCR